MPKVQISDEAKADLFRIWLYSYERWSLEQADRYYNDLRETIHSLSTDQERGSPLTVRPRMRRLLMGSHSIYYRPIAEGVEIIRILHQSEDQNRNFT